MYRERRNAARGVGRVVVTAVTLLFALLTGGVTANAAAAGTGTTANPAAAVAVPVTQAAPNGCGSTYTWWIVPDNYRQYDPETHRLVGTARFTGSCNDHDRCYGGSNARRTCDGVFRRDLQGDCRAAFAAGSRYRDNCYGMVTTYYNSVRWFGRNAYKGSGDPS